MRHFYGLPPIPGLDPLNLLEISAANPKYNLFGCYLLRPRPRKENREFAQRARAYVIKWCDLLPQLFIAARQHLCAAKSQFTNDFREKCDFLDVGFDQENLQLRSHNLEGQPRKSASRANVGEPTVLQGYGLGGVHTLAKMTIKYLQRVADSRQVYFFIPGQQNLDILLNLKHLIVKGRNLEFSEGAPYHGR